ncbi:MAG: hypothetical protein JWN67_1168 [Actinomycetia bacterium]|nr:hypothetical protein [Actinomycetes bacterium]
MTDLETRLADLADHLDVPEGAGLAAAVGARLRTERPRRRWPWLVALAVAVGVGVPAVPAVAHWLGIGAVAVHEGSAPGGPPLDLGRRVTLAEAERGAGFRPLLPARLGRPDEIWLDDRGPAPIVWLRWIDGPLLTELRGEAPNEPLLHKFAGRGRVEPVDVAGRPGLWVTGVHEVVVMVGDVPVVQRVRLAGSTLVVQVGDVTVRVEGVRDRADAIRLAASLGT